MTSTLVPARARGIVRRHSFNRLPDCVVVAVDAGTQKAVVAARCYASFIRKRLPGIPALLVAVNTKSVLDNDVAFVRGANLHRVAAESGCFLNDCCYFVEMEAKGEFRAVVEELVKDTAIV